MIIGIGTDILRTDRMKKALERTDGFEDRVFAPEEISYCRSKARPERHYAARFAAKEAVMKALGSGWAGGIRFKDIVVINDKKGKPCIEVREPSRNLIPDIDRMRIRVSLSHDEAYAVAMVAIECDQKSGPNEKSNDAAGAS
jgi:holo-[acyl-carrier protein] synthase